MRRKLKYLLSPGDILMSWRRPDLFVLVQRQSRPVNIDTKCLRSYSVRLTRPRFQTSVTYSKKGPCKLRLDLAVWENVRC